MYIVVASPDPNPRGGVNYLTITCNSTLTSGTRGEALTPNPSGTSEGTGAAPTYIYIYKT